MRPVRATATRARAAGAIALVPLLSGLGGCRDGERAGPASTSTSAAAESKPAATVDHALQGNRISVVGTAEVGQTLSAQVSPDLAGDAIEWGWHRCTDVPTCATISGAEGPSYRLTEEDAWQVIRVIAVVDRASEARTGPVVDPDPEPFREQGLADPSRGTGLALIVAPGQLFVTIDAECPVVAVAGVKTATTDGSRVSGTASVEAPARRLELTVTGEGGLLTVATSGACGQATVEVSGRR